MAQRRKEHEDSSLAGATLISGTGRPPIVNSLLIIENGNIRGVGQSGDREGVVPVVGIGETHCEPRAQIQSAGPYFRPMELLSMTLSCPITLGR